MAVWPVPDDGTTEYRQVNLSAARRSQPDSEVPSGSSPGQLGVGGTLHLELSPFLPAQQDLLSQLEAPTPSTPFRVSQENEAFALVWNHLEDEKLGRERLRGRAIV